MKELLSTGEYAKVIGVHPQTLRRYEREGKLKCTRTLGNHRRFESPKQKIEGKIVGYASKYTRSEERSRNTSKSTRTTRSRHGNQRSRFRDEL
jgi:excisionase family DNA binding protein